MAKHINLNWRQRIDSQIKLTEFRSFLNNPQDATALDYRIYRQQINYDQYEQSG